jgi:hypothetical protein
MSVPSDYKRTLERLMHELDQAICEDRAHAAIWNAHTAQSMSFFHVAFSALSNDCVAHAIKVLDRHPKAASFWYVVKHKDGEIRSFCADQSISLSEIETMSDRLKGIRDRTHFHIDRRDVFDPEAVWRRAGVKHSHFTAVLDSLWRILDHLYIAEHGQSFGSPDYYTGADVEPILRAVKEARVVDIVFRNDP